MMRRIGILFVLIFINCLFESCGGGSSPRCFDLTFSAVDNYSISTFQRLEEGDTTEVAAYTILLEGMNAESMCRRSFSTGASLMAESPVHILTNNIIHLSIKSTAPINANLLAGAELSDFFELVVIDEACNPGQTPDLNCIENRSDGWPDDDLLKVINETATYGGLFNEDFPSTTLYGLNMTLDSVFDELNHVFTVQFEFNDGQVLEFDTPGVFLK